MCFFLSPSYNCFFSPSHELLPPLPVPPPLASHDLSLSSLVSHELPLSLFSSCLLPSSQSFLRRRSHRVCSLWRLFHLISTTRSLGSSRNPHEFQLRNLEKGLPQYKAAPLFDKTKQALGGRVRILLSGAAPSPRHVEEFMRATSGSTLSQGYGLTESCAGCFTAIVDSNANVNASAAMSSNQSSSGSAGVKENASEVVIVDDDKEEGELEEGEIDDDGADPEASVTERVQSVAECGVVASDTDSTSHKLSVREVLEGVTVANVGVSEELSFEGTCSTHGAIRNDFTDLTSPHTWYPPARRKHRRIILHVGPTNSGQFSSSRGMDSKDLLFVSKLGSPPVKMFLNPMYPTELSRRAKINSVMDWQHSNLRNGADTLPLVTRLWDTYLVDGDALPDFLVYIFASFLLTVLSIYITTI
ncbi:hypothetical protein S83_011736 [Arachis hypogaea]